MWNDIEENTNVYDIEYVYDIDIEENTKVVSALSISTLVMEYIFIPNISVGL